MLATVLTLSIVIAGYLVMFGATKAAWRLLFVVVLVALLLPCITATVSTAQFSLPQGGGVVLVLVGVLLVGVALVRFINHRRALKHWLGDEHTSLKKRVERL